MYDPGQGRFLQRDPVMYFDGMSVYEYVKSMPGERLDPTGRESLRCKQLKDMLLDAHLSTRSVARQISSLREELEPISERVQHFLARVSQMRHLAYLHREAKDPDWYRFSAAADQLIELVRHYEHQAAPINSRIDVLANQHQNTMTHIGELEDEFKKECGPGIYCKFGSYVISTAAATMQLGGAFVPGVGWVATATATAVDACNTVIEVVACGPGFSTASSATSLVADVAKANVKVKVAATATDIVVNLYDLAQ